MIQRLVEVETTIASLEAKHGLQRKKLELKIKEQEDEIRIKETLVLALRANLENANNAKIRPGSRDITCHKTQLKILRERSQNFEKILASDSLHISAVAQK